MTPPARPGAPTPLPGRGVRRVASARLPTELGQFTAHAYRDGSDTEHLALVHGPADAGEPVLVRVHSECVTGEVFGSRRCDCGPQLHGAMEAIVAAGSGILVYLRGHEGRGIGIASKIAAYSLQDHGCDTVDANIRLGFAVDGRDYAIAARILADLAVTRCRVLTNNPAKIADLERHGVQVVERIGVPAYSNPDNVAYLRTKQLRMGHLLGVDRRPG